MLSNWRFQRSAAGRSGAARLLQLIENLFLVGKTPFIVLGKDLIVADHDVEYTATSLDQLRFDPEFLLDLGRQTGGSRKIISNYAVFDLNVQSSTSR